MSLLLDDFDEVVDVDVLLGLGLWGLLVLLEGDGLLDLLLLLLIAEGFDGFLVGCLLPLVLGCFVVVVVGRVGLVVDAVGVGILVGLIVGLVGVMTLGADVVGVAGWPPPNGQNSSLAGSSCS